MGTAASVVATPSDRKTAVGTAVWAGLAIASFLAWIRLELTEILFLLAPWVVLPLATKLVPLVADCSVSTKVRRVFDSLLVPAAALATASFFLPVGRLAAALATPWLLVCVLLASEGLMRLWCYRQTSFAQFCFAMGQLYLPVGASWLVVSRLGRYPLGFGEPIVFLTAVHFHFAGFLSAVLAGVTYENSRRGLWAAPLRAGLFGVVLGPALLSGAFLVGPRPKVMAASLIVIGQLGLAAAMFRVGITTPHGYGRWMLCTSAACLVAGMALAAIWAAGEYSLHPLVNMGQMARLHGVLNALGFGTVGVLGWAQILRARQSSPEVRK